jgi:hypothetical protein
MMFLLHIFNRMSEYLFLVIIILAGFFNLNHLQGRYVDFKCGQFK